jgi:hypothetical protein
MRFGQKVGLSMVLVALGFVGAAIRYWRWWPNHSDPYSLTGFACPFCPNMDSLGTNWQKFISRTVLGGFLNVVPFLIVGWLLIHLERRRRTTRRERSLKCAK